jgi:hypothetical protein
MSASSTMPAGRGGRRGRPPKYGRPAKVVAITLPAEVVEALQRVHSDLGWAVVSLTENAQRAARQRPSSEDVQLVQIGRGQSLIVVDSARFRALPGVRAVPISSTQAFLALEAGHGMADLELAVLDRIERLPTADERRAWERLRDRLRAWRLDRRLEFENRSVIIVSRRRRRRGR